MAIKDKTQTVYKVTKEEQDRFNQWCRDMNVSRQYYYPTQYYKTEWNTHNEVEGDGLLHRLLHWIFK